MIISLDLLTGGELNWWGELTEKIPRSFFALSIKAMSVIIGAKMMAIL